MKYIFALTILLFQVVNISSLTEINQDISISQKKCEFYQNMFKQPATEDYPYLVRIYNGYYLNGNLVIENNVEFLNGVIISEDFVLTIANNITENLLFVEVFDMQLEVIQKVTNEQQNIVLLKLSESLKFSEHIRPACLPQSQYSVYNVLSEIICWVDNNRLNHLTLTLALRGSCKKNSKDYVKRLRLQSIYDGNNFCNNVVTGDRDSCNVPSSILLNDQQEVVGVATEYESAPLQIFLQVSEHVSWIENIVWNSTSVSSTSSTTITTEQTSELPLEYGSTSTTNVFDSTIANEPSPIETKPLSQIDVELHDIHIFLNVNLILIVVILFLVLCISSILWSDGLCIRAALPNRFETAADIQII